MKRLTRTARNGRPSVTKRSDQDPPQRRRLDGRPDLNPQAAAGQAELFAAWRYHAVFTDSPFETIEAEEQHRGHAQAEQVFADWTDGPLAHLPYVD